MKIQVTQDDIDNGLPRTPCNCPVAIALRRQLKRDFFVDFLRIHRHPYKETYKTPPEVHHFIHLFDQSQSRHLCTPFEFELDLSTIDIEEI